MHLLILLPLLDGDLVGGQVLVRSKALHSLLGQVAIGLWVGWVRGGCAEGVSGREGGCVGEGGGGEEQARVRACVRAQLGGGCSSGPHAHTLPPPPPLQLTMGWRTSTHLRPWRCSAVMQ